MSNELQISYSSMWLTMTVVGLSLLLGEGLRPSGIRTWSLALILQAVGWGLLAACPFHEASRWATASAGSAALVASVGCMTLTAAHFLHLRVGRRWLLGPPVAALLVGIAAHGHADMGMAWVSLVMATQMAAIAFMLFPKRRGEWRTRWRRLACGGYLAATGVVGLPTLLYLAVPAHTLPAPNASWTDVFSSIVANGWAIVAIVCTLAFLLAHRDEAEQALHRLASRDGLTGLLNRRAFMEAAERHLATCRRAGGEPALMILDLDHFKRVNDTHGHSAGDAVIALFARLLAECAGAQDVVDRHGGEEFCILLPGGLRDARELDRRLRQRLAGEASKALGFEFDFSAGAATLAPEDGGSVARLIDRADHALYAAKHAGRGRMVLAEDVDVPTVERESPPLQRPAERQVGEPAQACRGLAQA